MSRPTPMRDYVVPGLVTAESVEALAAYGEPMVTDRRGEANNYVPTKPFSAWTRKRGAGQYWIRNMGPLAATPQEAADALLHKLTGGRE